ncbi:MAG TPA: helix-turn-helix domain-containing protein [Anaerolineales bacterium]|nr:helix-turn-helix domain-containing protein [Anaerolineales bacterium]
MDSNDRPAGRVLRIEAETERGHLVLKALASEPRVNILRHLRDRVCNMGEIGEALQMPPSTITLHIGLLEDAGLVKVELRPAVRGLQKMIARVYDVIQVMLPRGEEAGNEQWVDISIPIGGYSDCRVSPTCGLAGEDGIIGFFDDPTSFFEPDRLQAQLIWFHHGFVEYRLPNRLPPKATPESLNLSLEICSEAPLHHEDWPSDITLWINGVEIGTWTCPADFGGQRGVLTPKWWEDWNSQYGLLKVWQVTKEGSYIDGRRLSNVVLPDLQLGKSDGLIEVRIGVKEDATHVGGINIFGRKFGNYPQDILMRIRYEPF